MQIQVLIVHPNPLIKASLDDLIRKGAFFR